MKPSSKVILVIGGYLLALAIAWAVVAVYVAATSGPDRQTYGAMFAFGDTILFLLSSRFAPTRATRLALLGAGAVEAVLFVSVELIWFHPFRQHQP